MITAKILADSTNHDNNRVTTFELEYPRQILAEVNTHRVFSRNSASSRAIPLDKMIELVRKNPAIPIWTKNQKGMSGEIVEDPDVIYEANLCWLSALESMIRCVDCLKELGIHKQNANRLLEPFQHMKTVLTSTDFDNCFRLRISKAAQPEFCELATKMKELYENSTPHVLKDDEVHCPYTEKGYCRYDDMETIYKSVALCAQVSYRKEDGSPETVKRIVNNLISHEQIHASPFEHIAMSDNVGEFHRGNLNGYKQLRHCVEEFKKSNSDADYDTLLEKSMYIWLY